MNGNFVFVAQGSVLGSLSSSAERKTKAKMRQSLNNNLRYHATKGLVAVAVDDILSPSTFKQKSFLTQHHRYQCLLGLLISLSTPCWNKIQTKKFH